MNEPKPMNEHCRLEHSDWNYLERSEDELCPVCRGEQEATERIIKLVEKFRFNEELGFSFEQAKEDLLTLIKGEK